MKKKLTSMNPRAVVGVAALIMLLLLIFAVLVPDQSTRYQATWNGRSYLITDVQNGHLWVFREDSMVYLGRVHGRSFTPPENPNTWRWVGDLWEPDT